LLKPFKTYNKYTQIVYHYFESLVYVLTCTCLFAAILI